VHPTVDVKAAVRQVLQGDRDAYRTVVKEFGPAIRALLAAHLSQPDPVDDLAQETFVAAYESLGHFNLAEDLGLWLKGIARNKLLMHLRRLYQHGKALERLKAEALEEVAEDLVRAQREDDAQTVDRLRRCLEQLPPRVVDAVRARYFEHERVSSIAGKLGTTATAISSLLFRGRKELEACLGRAR
jgi:RNA polymerase sigma-70 factor (ECF subfamily)